MSDVVTVIFVGLISHMNLSHTNTAVLPVAAEHRARLYIKRPNQQRVSIPIDGLRIRIYGASNAEPKPDPSFSANVPHIGAMLGCRDETDLKAEIQDPSHILKSNDITAFVDYEGDSLSAPNTYPERLKFNGAASGSKFQCVACKVVLTATPANGTKMWFSVEKIGAKKKVLDVQELPAGTTVIVRNAPFIGHHVSGDHFQHYYALVDGCAGHSPILTQAESAPSNTCAGCEEAAPAISPSSKRGRNKTRLNVRPELSRLMPTVECADSQYP
jgi:hypothetical protein